MSERNDEECVDGASTASTKRTKPEHYCDRRTGDVSNAMERILELIEENKEPMKRDDIKSKMMKKYPKTSERTIILALVCLTEDGKITMNRNRDEKGVMVSFYERT